MRPGPAPPGPARPARPGARLGPIWRYTAVFSMLLVAPEFNIMFPLFRFLNSAVLRHRQHAAAHQRGASPPRTPSLGRNASVFAGGGMSPEEKLEWLKAGLDKGNLPQHLYDSAMATLMAETLGIDLTLGHQRRQ